MSFRHFAVITTFFILCSGLSLAEAAKSNANRIQLKLNTDESEAVLGILAKNAMGHAIPEDDWQHLFATEPYIRLKKREASMKRDFTDDDFKKFVLSPELAAKAQSLRHTLEDWEKTDLNASAARVLTYLPEQAMIRAKVFPMIKPKINSFVFDTETDPAIFLYLDPQESAAKFENTVAHELHHIGFASVRSLSEAKLNGLPANVKSAVEWMGAFGEGFAMLAAAGGPDVHPHTVSSPEERARWDHDMANFNQDLATVQSFFLNVINGKFKNDDEIRAKASEFYGEQGPWYTVGYEMAVIVERKYGRATLIDCMVDPRDLLSRYNSAAAGLNSRRAEQLALWSPELLTKIGLAK